MRFEVEAVPAQDFDGWLAASRSRGPAARRRGLRAARAARAPPAASATGWRLPGLFDAIVRVPRRDASRAWPQRCRSRQPSHPATPPRMKVAMLGKLSWAALPLGQPIPLAAGAMVVLPRSSRAGAGDLEGLVAVALARLDHQRRPQAHRRDVRRAGAGHAAARLRRRDDDALAAGAGRRRRAGLSCRRSTTTRSSRRTARS